MARALLVLPTSTYRAPEFLSAARRLGVEVVTASDAPQALGGLMGDRFLEVDLSRPEEAAGRIVELAARLPLDAVLAVDDQGGLAAAIACDRLGLPHSPPAAVAATRDKAAARRLLGAAGVPQPAWRAVSGRPGDRAGEAEAVAAAAEELGFPVVVKPVSLSGSRGVVRADDAASAEAAAARVRAVLDETGEPPEVPLLVEAYVAGAEVAVEAIVREGRLEVLAVFDKPDPLEGPYFEETIYVTPSRHPGADLAAAADAVARAAGALGIVHGPVHAEARLAGAPATEMRPDEVRPAGARPAGARRPVVLEVAARTIGGKCSKALRFATGASLEEIVLAGALGRTLDSTRERAAAGVMMIPVPRSGTLDALEGADRAREVDFVTGVEITAPVGRVIRALPEGDRYLGFLFARAPTPSEVERALRRAHAELVIKIS